MKTEKPYLIEYRIKREKNYNLNYGDDRLCKCGHIYSRHFDSYDEMYNCGCKYCACYNFREGEIK